MARYVRTSVMINKEASLAKIVGPMSLSKNTDVSTQSSLGPHWCGRSSFHTDEDPGLGKTSVFLDNDIGPTDLASEVYS